MMKDIKNRTSRIAENVEKAIEWANHQDDEVTQSSVENALKSLQRSLITIDRAIQKRPSIAIFGQSQVGKSYLVQNLAKPENESFLKIYTGETQPEVNFLTEINPDGGQESTGLVTRFTTEKTKDNQTHPFSVELFSQLDIAAILINSYWSDLKDYGDNIEQADLDEAKSNLVTLKDKKNYTDLEEYDIHYFIEYILNNLKDVFLIRDLKKIGFFNELYVSLSQVKYDKRWEILQILWGDNKFITEIFKMLSESIEEMDFEKNVFITLDALSPNSSTILDVERVRELFETNKEIDDVHVSLKNNKEVKIDRSIFSILTKEVRIQIANSFKKDEDRKFMNYSDLLDFPGSKSREKILLSVFNGNTSKQKLQLLIRGKVSYLFDSYTKNLGVATLLYCMDDNPPEEKEAPSRLYKWVKKYVGENKEERSRKLAKTLDIIKSDNAKSNHVSPLLVVLTKFNQEINKVIPGKETDIDSHDSKWNARIEENFVNFMSRPVDDKWLLNWTNDQEKFNFIFPVRDPLYSQATFEGFETDDKETRIRPERKEAMNSIGLSFQASKHIQNHIINPKEVWSELSSPNGSGIRYLSKHLKNSANPELTKTRLNFELNKINRDFKSIIKPHIISGNIDDDLKKAKKEANKSFTGIVGLSNREDNILSSLMSNMLISDTEVWNIVYDNIFKNDNNNIEAKGIDVNVIQSFNDLGIVIKKDSTKEVIIEQLNDIYEGLEYEEIREIIIDYINFDINNVDQLLYSDNSNDKNSLADIIIKNWVNKCISFTLDNYLIEKLSEKQEEALRTLINEILKSRERLNLKDEIHKVISDVQSGTINIQDIDLVASCCSKMLNNFLFTSGWFFVDENKKPILRNNNLPIFSEYAKELNINDLNYVQSEITKTYFKEWSFGCKKIFEENVKYEYGVHGNINTKNNTMLSSVFKSIEKENSISE